MKVDVVCVGRDGLVMGHRRTTVTMQDGRALPGRVLVPIEEFGPVYEVRAYLPSMDIETPVPCSALPVYVKPGDTITIECPRGLVSAFV